MPRLPDFTALGAPTQPVASEAIPHYSADGFVYTGPNGLEAAGQAIQNIGGIFREKERKADALQSAQADAQFQSDFLSTLSDLQHNPDYEQTPQLYQQRTRDALNRAASLIADPQQQQLFITRHEDNIARGAYQLNQHIWRQRADATIADTQNKLDDLRSKALVAADPQVRTQLITTGRNLITGLADAGYINRVAAQKLQKDWTNKYATDALNAMPPDDVMGIVTKALGEKPTEQQPSAQGPQSSITPLQPSPGRSPDVADVDPRLVESVSRGAAVLPPGYKVTINEGYNPNGHVSASQHHVKGSGALDVQIWGPDGKPIPNEGPDTTGMYKRLALASYRAAGELGVGDRFAWGGRFGTTETSGVPDLMHFDLGGDRGHLAPPLSEMAQGSEPPTQSGTTELSAQRQKTGTVADFLTVDQLQTAYKNAERRKQANILDQERAIRFQDMQQKHISEQEVGNLLPRIYGNDTALTAQEVLADPKLTVQDKEHVIRLMHTGGDSTDVKSFGPGFYDLFSRIHAPDDDPNKITDPSQLYSHVGPNGDLTVRGLDKLRGELQSKRTPEGEAEAAMKKQFLDNAKRQISGTDPILHIRDPKGDELYLKFLAQFYKAYDAGKQGGKSASQLLNPDSPDYLGKGISDFRRTPDQMFKDMMSGPDALGGTPADTSGGTSAPLDVNSIKTVQQAVDAYRSGKITKAQADQLAISRGWGYRPAPTPTIPLSR